MSKLAVTAFGALVVATVAAFFVTQHLKVTTPLIAGSPAPLPAWINPVDGNTCVINTPRGRRPVSFRSTNISFYLLHRSDVVDVSVVNQAGEIVATLASSRHMRTKQRTGFTWNGREDNGSLAPDGQYYVRVALIHQGRTIEITNSSGDAEPITVRTTPPHPIVTDVSPSLVPDPNGTTHVTIHYAGNEHRGGTIELYRTDLPGRPQLVKSFLTPWNRDSVGWDGTVRGRRPAPQGVYLVGLDVFDAACNKGSFPAIQPPPLGSTPHAGVTVTYLDAQPPLDPVAAGSSAQVYVDSRQQPYTWRLWRVGAAKPVSAGQVGSSFEMPLQVRLPPTGPGLYTLALRSGVHATAVPLVAYGAYGVGGKRVKILVVLPALSWQGQNPVDADGDGIPDTLDGGQSVDLDRPFLQGLPAGFADEAALVAYLDKAHLPYNLTTDVGLIDGTGPRLTDYAGVVFAGSERWLPASLASQLRAYVAGGGRVLSIGVDSLRRSVRVKLAGGGGAVASDPGPPSSVDAFGARPGALVTNNSGPVIQIKDGLGIFRGTSGAFPGFTTYQPVQSVSAPAQILSSAGASSAAPVFAGWRSGKGIVVELGVPGFGSSLAHGTNSQELLGRLWTVLGQ